MIEIPLTRGKVAIVDDCDADLAALKWHASPNNSGSFYAARRRPRMRLLHAIVAERAHGPRPRGAVTDHRDGDTPNNTRRNLRWATPSGNLGNSRKPSGGRSRFKGVSLSYGRWKAQVQVGGREMFLGRFVTEEEAARAYDAAARRTFGEFARVNFPG